MSAAQWRKAMNFSGGRDWAGGRTVPPPRSRPAAPQAPGRDYSAALRALFSPAHVILLLALLLYPAVASPFFTFQIGAQSLTLGLIALSLTLLAGYGGMLSLAQMTVAGIAGYAVAIFGTSGTAEVSLGWPWWLAVMIAVVVAVIAGTLIGWLSVRTEGIYTIMITLAIGVAFFYLAQQNYAVFNGFQGFQRVLPPVVLGIDWRAPVPFYFLALLWAVLGYAFVTYLIRSPFGIALQGVRDNPRRMNALGFNVIAHRIAAYAVAGFIAAIGGVLLVWYNGLISPGSVGTTWLINILIIAVLGGLRHPIGPFLGALVFVLLQNFAVDLIDRERFNLLIGAVFLAIVLFSPDGLLGWWGGLRRILTTAGAAARLGGRTGKRAPHDAFINAAREPHNGSGGNMSRRTTKAAGAVLGAALAGTFAFDAAAQETIKLGLLATLEGPFAAGGQDGMRGAELAVRLRNGMVAGKKIEIIKASSDARPDVAVNATRKLVEQDKVQIMIGPLSGSEGIAVKDYSKTQPGVTFINGGSGAQATTLVDPSPNFFRFNTEGAQWMSGLGNYAFTKKGYKKMALVAEDYSFPYSQVQGFMVEYCKAGGKVTHKAWVPLGGKDYSSVIARLPADVDALLVVLGGSDAVNFLTQYEQAGGDKPMVGGSITVDQTVLNFRGKRRESLLGTLSAGPIADSFDGADWKKFVADYKAAFPDGFPSPSLFAYVYHINTKAALDALEQVNGDLSNNQAKFRETLAKMTLKTPTGEVKLDENRQAIGTTFITEVAQGPGGVYYNKVVDIVPNVDQRLGMSKADFDKMGLGSRDVPSCP